MPGGILDTSLAPDSLALAALIHRNGIKIFDGVTRLSPARKWACPSVTMKGIKVGH